MSNRGGHVTKNLQQKQAYGRYIQARDYEPTVREGIDFGSTEKAGEELSESTSNRRARGRTKYVVREHFKDHWIEWVVGILVIIALFLVNESRVTMAIMESSLSDVKETVRTISGDLRSAEQRVQNLELESLSNSKDIEHLKEK